ncbi:hypothetical protein LIER_21144 [Lithospermum erythrorhizon]|uniref:Glucose-methanol-choline oxidoreductase N-terminal domain-containing protein n=1 Tax=Lithospermum erythrorhizon TaxID=34254 RepID=A0AAV3QQA8_LITER
MVKTSCLWSSSYGFLILVVALICLPNAHSLQSNSYMGFVSNATEFKSEEYYDYIIVGGGTAGCPLAATLSENYKVLVLERGGVPHGVRNLMTPEGFLTVLTDVDTHDSPVQSFTSEEGIPNARGRILGGSSAINAGFYSRADQEFYRKSLIEWDFREVNQSYKWVENAIVFRPELKSWQSAIRDGLLEAGVGPYNDFSLDHVVGTKVGGSTFDTNGRRYSAVDLLNYANPANIKVVVHASVERILLASSSDYSGPQQAAIGVVFCDRLRRYHHAMVRKGGEVLLSAGSLGTPQLLLLSGIGPRPYLSSWGIPVARHLPYVGQFMYDNPRNGISIVPPIPVNHSLIQVVGITNSGSYLEAASSRIPFASLNPFFVGAPSSPIYLTVATLMEKIIEPLSAGTLRLASTDVSVNPLVRFNYFSNPTDIQRCVNGTRIIGDVLRSRSFQDFRFPQLFGGTDFRFVGPALPTDQSDDSLMEDFCRRTVNTIWHYHGGCLVGKVVDADLRVIGIESLRVVDGSVFSISPGTNPQASVLMLGRYIGQKILRERMRST